MPSKRFRVLGSGLWTSRSHSSRKQGAATSMHTAKIASEASLAECGPLSLASDTPPPLLSIWSVGSLAFLYSHMSFEIMYAVYMSCVVCMSMCARGIQEMLLRVIHMCKP